MSSSHRPPPPPSTGEYNHLLDAAVSSDGSSTVTNASVDNQEGTTTHVTVPTRVDVESTPSGFEVAASTQLLKERISQARRRSVNTFSANYGTHSASFHVPSRQRQGRSASVPDFRFPDEVHLEGIRSVESRRNPAAASALDIVSRLYLAAQNSPEGVASVSMEDLSLLGRSIQLALHTISDPTSVERTILNSTETDDPLVQQYLLDSFTPTYSSHWGPRGYSPAEKHFGQSKLDKSSTFASLPQDLNQRANEVTRKIKAASPVSPNRRDSAPPKPLYGLGHGHAADASQLRLSADHRSYSVQKNARGSVSNTPSIPFANPLGETNTAAQAMLENLNSWDFEIFKLHDATQGKPLRLTAWQCITNDDLVSKLGLDRIQIQRFIAAVEDCYLDNPYHNPTHVADVTQSVYALTKMGEVSLWMSPLQQYIMIMAAAIHDVGHPGVNNAFLISTFHPLAITYNDSSPLENMHVAFAFRLMQCAGFDALSGLDGERRWSFRSTVIKMVLGTDNASHFKNLAELTQKIDSWYPSASGAFCSIVSDSTPQSADQSPRRESQDLKGQATKPGSKLAPKRASTPEFRRASHSSATSQDSAYGESSSSGHTGNPLLNDEQGQELVMQIMLHAADVSNVSVASFVEFVLCQRL